MGKLETRIHWKEPTRRQLAAEVLATLDSRGKVDSFTDRELLHALRDIIPIVLTSDKQRDIRGMHQIPWLRKYIEEARSPVVLTMPTEGDTQEREKQKYDDLFLDTLIDVGNKLDTLMTVQAAQTETINSLVEQINRLGGNVQGLTHLITQKRAKAAEKSRELEEQRKLFRPPPQPIQPEYPKPLKITIAGILRGEQRAHIENALKGFPYNIQISFEDASRGVSQIPRFDELIIMHWVGRPWSTRAMHQFQGKTHYAKGIKEALDMIHNLGQCHERCIINGDKS